MKKKRIIIAGIGFIFVLLAVGVFVLTRDLSYMRSVELHGINLTSVDDGSHIGTFERGRFTNTLTVHVLDNTIMRIDIINDVLGAGVTNASGETFERVIGAQDTKIDAIAGATATTTAYLKAVEDALMGGEGQ